MFSLGFALLLWGYVLATVAVHPGVKSLNAGECIALVLLGCGSGLITVDGLVWLWGLL